MTGRTPLDLTSGHSAVAGTSHVLGVLPLGTSNNFARSLGIPLGPCDAADLPARDKVATVDLGRFTPDGGPPRHFVHAATVGLNVGFARIATRGDLRNRLGRYAYLLAAAPAGHAEPHGGGMATRLNWLRARRARRQRRARSSTTSPMATALVGISRVYLGAHWTTDAIGGWIVGVIWLTAVLTSWITITRTSVSQTEVSRPTLAP